MTEPDKVRSNTMDYMLQYFQCDICGSKQVIRNGFKYACAVGDPGNWNHSHSSDNAKMEPHGKVFITPDPKDCNSSDEDSDE